MQKTKQKNLKKNSNNKYFSCKQKQNKINKARKKTKKQKKWKVYNFPKTKSKKN